MSSEKHKEPPLQDQQKPRAVGNPSKGTPNYSLVVTPGHSASESTSLIRTFRPIPLGVVGAQENTELARLVDLLQTARETARKFVEEYREDYKTGAQIEKIREGIDQYNKELKDITAFKREYDQIKEHMALLQKKEEDHFEKMMNHQRAAEQYIEQMIRHQEVVKYEHRQKGFHQKEAEKYAKRHTEEREANYHQKEFFKHQKQYDELKTKFDSMDEQIEDLTQRALNYKRKRDVLKWQLAGAQRANACLQVFRESSAGI